jgi:transcriptional antiterminator RfaH
MPWHAIYVSSRSEKKVGELLTYKNIDAYVPLVKTMRQWADRKKMVEFPLLNGYVFVNINEIEKDKVFQTKGVVNFVRSEGKIAVLKNEEIERLKQLVTLGYQIQAASINKKYNEGDKIKIMSGALKGIEGYVIEDPDNRTLEVLLEGISQCIRVKIPKNSVIEIEKKL